MAAELRRTAVVTGASSGIGLAVSESLVGAGYEVWMMARSADRLQASAERIGAHWVAVDAADETAMEEAFADIGRVDLLVHSAGVFSARSTRKQPAREFEEIVNTNLTGAYVASRTALGKMGPGGRIVLVSSISGVDGHRWLTAYAASKAAVRLMAESMRAEVESDGISITVLILATVDTPMMKDIARPAILVEDVSSAVLWLDSMHPRVRIPELVLRSADDSPLGYRIVPEESTAPII
jgi:NAD(P)-dependent dehydrogenase (short-subunit alcohol dehydrogenase family)